MLFFSELFSLVIFELKLLLMAFVIQEAKGFTIIDVREPNEVARTGLIPTARNIPRAVSLLFKLIKYYRIFN